MSGVLSQFPVRLLAMLVALVPLSILAAPEDGAESTRHGPAASTPGEAVGQIQYRRVYVPADKMDAWPRRDEKLIPIEASEFDELVRAANRAAASPGNRVAISAAEYSAKLDASGALRGTGRWTISRRGNEPAFLALGDTSLMLQNARWDGAAQLPARLGAWAASGKTSDLFGLDVPRSGVLDFDFHIPVHTVDDQIEIPWRVPNANSIRLTLDLPDGKQPRIEGGVVLESLLRPADDKTPERPLRRWVIAVPSSPAASLQIVSTDRKAASPASQITLDEDIHYQIGPRGLELTAHWKLAVPPGQSRELAIAVPSGLQLSSIKAGEGDPAWRLIRDASTPTDTAIIELPKADGTEPVQITFSAWQPLVTSGPWRLPRLRPEGVFWSSGKMELSVAATHELSHLTTTDCVETKVGRLDAREDAPETHSFVEFSPSAALEINLAERQADTTIRSGSSLALADPNLTGRLVSQLTLSRGATHQLVGNVAPGWIVEAIETIPADAMTEWFVDKNGNEQRIEVQLSRAASATQSVTVIVTARLQRFNLNERLSADTIRMVRWSGMKSDRHLLTFQSSELYTVVPVGRLTELAVEAVDTGDRPLLDTVSESKVYDLTDAGSNAGLQFMVRRGQFAAHVAIEGTYENETLRVDYQLKTETASAPIDRILVYATSSLGDTTRWIEKSTGQPVTAEKLAPDDPQRANLPKEGEAWLLRFAQPSTRAMELTATTTFKRPDRAQIPLLHLPEASQQDASVAVRSRNASSLWLEPNHLQTIPAPPRALEANDANTLPAVCAAYRYRPADCLNPTQAPTLAATANRSAATTPLVARRVELESYFWPDGQGAHRATYYLDSHGTTDVKIRRPAGATLSSASTDGSSLDIVAPTSDGQPLVLRLQGQARPTKLSLFFKTTDAALTAGSELAPPNFATDISFISGNWTLFLPEEFSVSGDRLRGGATAFNWRERLFGVLGRPMGARPFNPFRLADGAALVNGLIDGSMGGTAVEGAGQDQPAAARDPQLTAVTAQVAAPPVPSNGWRRFEEAFVASGPAPVVVLHPPATTAWVVALLLACLLCGVRLRRVHPTAFAVLLAVAAALALGLSAPYASLASGAVLGLLLALVAGWPWLEKTAALPDRSARFNSATTVALAFIMATLVTTFGFAESAPPNGERVAPKSDKIHRLFIPTDDKGQQSGSKYYLSDELLRTLVGHAATARNVPGHWLLNGATFAGELAEPMGHKQISGGNWTLTFAIETLSRDATVVLPLVQSEADWAPIVMLDGVPLPIDWRDSGHSCAVHIAEPGKYSLTLTCTPKVSATEGLAQIDLTIPQVHGAKVEVRHPETVSAVSIANASIMQSSGAEKSVSGELDRATHLNVRWSHVDKSDTGSSGFTLSEMRWLHVTPTKVELTAKCILEGGGRRPDSLTFTHDSRWNLVTTAKSLSAKVSERAGSGQRQLLVPLAAQASDRQEIVVRWQLENPPEYGNLRLPPLELTSALPSKRWLAVSSDPALDCEMADSSAVESTSNEFFAKWGDAEVSDPPQTVLSNFDVRQPGSLSVRPRETESIVDESVSVLASLKTLRVRYEGRATPGAPGAYRTELAVPAELSIDEVTVTDADRQVPLRWSRNAKNRVTVFFGQEVRNAYHLVLNGAIAAGTNGKVPLPRIATLATEDATQKTYVHRTDNVQVDFEGLVSSTDPKTESPGQAPSAWSARPVGTCYLESGASLAAVTVKPVSTKVSGDSLTSLSRENSSWQMNYRCQLTVDGGDLDTIRLRVPEAVTGPFEVQSASMVTSEFKPADGGPGVLLVRLASSVPKGGTIDLRIRSPLKPPTGGMVAVPAVTVDALASGHRYLVVPSAVDSQVVPWTESGVRPAAIPAKLRTGFTLASPAKAFEVIGATFEVASRPSSAVELAPSIRLADTAVVADEQGAQRVSTRLIIAPHGLTSCVLQLPPEQSLVTVEIDGRPAMARQVDASKWQLALGAAQLPQAIDIVSRMPGPNAAEPAIHLDRPKLIARDVPIPAEISLWSFAHPEPAKSRVASGADEVTAEDQSGLRFDRLVSIAEASKAAATELPPVDGFNWYQPWSKLLTDAREVAQQAKLSPLLTQVESQVSHSAADQITQASTRLDKWRDDCRKAFAEAGAEQTPTNASVPKTTPASAEQLAEPVPTWSYYVAEGGNDRLTVNLKPERPTPAQTRVIGLAAIAAVLAVTLWLLRQPAAADALCRWPHAFGVLIGIAYWAWLWPSWLGLVIALVSLWLALRFHWPGRSIRTEASTVLRGARSI